MGRAARRGGASAPARVLSYLLPAAAGRPGCALLAAAAAGRLWRRAGSAPVTAPRREQRGGGENGSARGRSLGRLPAPSCFPTPFLILTPPSPLQPAATSRDTQHSARRRLTRVHSTTYSLGASEHPQHPHMPQIWTNRPLHPRVTRTVPHCPFHCASHATYTRSPSYPEWVPVPLTSPRHITRTFTTAPPQHPHPFAGTGCPLGKVGT